MERLVGHESEQEDSFRPDHNLHRSNEFPNNNGRDSHLSA